MKPTTPSFDGSLIMVAMARDLEVRLAAVLAGDRAVSLAKLHGQVGELTRNLEAQVAGRSAAQSVPLGAMHARMVAALRELGDEIQGQLTMQQRGAAWRLGAELVRMARELPSLIQG